MCTSANISVIIPTWNRQHSLERTLNTVFQQTLPCLEILVIDDGSTDATAALVRDIALSSPVPLHYLYQEHSGVSAARNTGIRAAQGQLLAFLDSDDWWERKKLAIQYQAMVDAPHFLLSHTREIWYRHGKRVNQKKKHDPPHGDIFAAALKMCVVGMSTVMARKEFFDRYGLFDEQLPCCEDYELWLRVAWQEPFLLVPHALTLKDGGREDQLSTIYRLGMDVYRIQAITALLDTHTLNTEQTCLALQELERKCTIYGRGCIKHGREKEGQAYLNLAQDYIQLYASPANSINPVPPKKAS